MLARHGFAYDPDPFKGLQPAFLASIHEEHAKRLGVRLCLWKASRTARRKAPQRAQYPFNKEYTLNYKDLIL